MRLAVYPDGAVVLTVPHRSEQSLIDRFLAKYAPWVERKIKESENRTVLRIKREEIPQIKKNAYDLVQNRATYFAQEYGFAFKNITIRAQKTRWGSCSHVGNLSFNYKIALLPQHLIDYIIVHEVCHLEEMNHSLRFWNLVARKAPQYERARGELRAIATVYT